MIHTELEAHQIDASSKMLSMKRHICAGDTGSGKTLIGLNLIEKIQQETHDAMALVLCPKTAVENTWEKEIKKHTNFTYALHDINTSKNLSVVAFPQLKEVLLYLRKNKIQNSILIIDECHILKSSDSQQATMLRDSKFGIMNYFSTVYGLTASPAMNHIEDIYYLVKSFFPDFFSSYEDFMNFYAIRVEKFYRVGSRLESYWEVVGHKNLDHLNKVLQQVMWRHAIDYKVQFFFEKCTLDKEEWKNYLDAGAGMLREDKFRDFMGRLPDLQQIVNGSTIANGDYNESPDLTSKEKALVRLLGQISDRGEGAIVFTSFRTTLRRFHRLSKHLKFDRYHFMSGDTDTGIRQKIVKNLSIKEVLFATKVGGTSLNLQAVNNVVFYDKPWSVGEIIQNIGRIARMDTKYTDLRAYFLDAEGTIDDYKTSMFSSNIDMVKSIIGGFDFTEVYFKAVKKDRVIDLRKSLLWSKDKRKKIKEKVGDSKEISENGESRPHSTLYMSKDIHTSMAEAPNSARNIETTEVSESCLYDDENEVGNYFSLPHNRK
jgi:superfamily II DNA or RNA helicase